MLIIISVIAKCCGFNRFGKIHITSNIVTYTMRFTRHTRMIYGMSRKVFYLRN